MANGSPSEEIIAALQRYPQDPAAATQMLESSANTDPPDMRLPALGAWMYAQQGRLSEAADITLQVITGGGSVAYLPLWIGQQLIGQGDQALRKRGADLLRYAASDSGTFDPYSSALQLVQLGDADAALELLDAVIQPRPNSQSEDQWRQLVAQASSQLGEIKAAAATAQDEKNRVVGDMDAVRDDVVQAKEDLERLVQEVGGLAGRAGAAVQADDYGRRADKIERLANRLTIMAVSLAFLIALGALILAITASQAADPLQAALEKAPISIPLLVVNIYIGRLAATYREEAVRLRHIELQIRTANPFLGALDEDRRKAVLAMLALRFFPGQPLPVPSHTSEPPDVAEALGTLLASSDSRSTVRVVSPDDGPSPPATPPVP